jgi:hypothetical protein
MFKSDDFISVSDPKIRVSLLYNRNNYFQVRICCDNKPANIKQFIMLSTGRKVRVEIGLVLLLGDFRTQFGAWIHRLFNGGGEIGKNEFGEWYVGKTRTEAMEDGNAEIVSYKYYGKGRNQYSSAGEARQAEEKIRNLRIIWLRKEFLFVLHHCKMLEKAI